MVTCKFGLAVICLTDIITETRYSQDKCMNEGKITASNSFRCILQVLRYNAPGGKRNRGLSVIGSLRELVPPSQLSPDDVRRALLVGWCIELVRRISGT